MLTLQQFAGAVQCTLMTAEPWHQAFLDAMAERSIDTPLRQAAFLAQVGHESGSLSHIEECLNYSAQRLMAVWPSRFPTIDKATFYEHAPERLANEVYANRIGNGPYESGDGWLYHGRGPIQITGRDNYGRCAIALNLPLLTTPEQLLLPVAGARSAAWFWEDRSLNGLADAGEIDQISRRINGGSEGLAQRAARYQQALRVLGA